MIEELECRHTKPSKRKAKVESSESLRAIHSRLQIILETSTQILNRRLARPSYKFLTTIADMENHMHEKYNPIDELEDDSSSSNSTHKATVALRGVQGSQSDSAHEPETPRKEEWIMQVMKEQFPPENLNFLTSFEKSPDAALRKSYMNGTLLKKVDENAPVLNIGIVFMAGGDKPSVIKAEMSKLKAAGPPNQKTPEWRVFTAGRLLNNWSIDEDLSMNRVDDSGTIAKRRQERKRISKGLGPGERPPKLQKPTPDNQESTELIRVREGKIHQHILTVDSDHVKLLHGGDCFEEDWDIACTLVEIDLFSMRDLMQNYRDIVHKGQRNFKAKDILPLLDTMINDVRRLCTRSPRLFRMSSRALIANSKNTRYGVDYGTQFVTLTTSEGIRQLVDKSSEFFLSLEDAKTEQDEIRPKFLQMQVLLLAFLNNEDLKLVKKVLETTFHIPGDRSNLELLIMKVLPLSSINPEVFLEGLYAAYKPDGQSPKIFDLLLQQGLWDSLQLELAEKGYIIPVPIEQDKRSPQAGSNRVVPDLRAQLAARRAGAAQRAHQGPSVEDNRKSFLPAWPKKGFWTSAVFRHLQHDGFLREEGDSSQGSVEGINEIPHLDISSEDIERDLVALFSNGVRYRVSATNADDISAMKKGTYLLSSTIEGETSSINLEIEHQALNEPFIEATRLLNSVVNSIKDYFEEGQQRRGLRDAFQRPSPVLFTPIDAPNPAWYFWAVVLDPDDAKKHEYCAEAFKINDRVVWQEDIIRGMNTALSKLDAAADRLDQEVAKYSKKKNEIAKLAETLTKVRGWMAKAKEQKAAVQKMNRTYSEDPIKKVFYPSFVNSLGSRPEWQQYASQLSETGTLIVKAKCLTVEFVEPKGNTVIIRFANCSITVSAEGLNIPKDSASNLMKAKDRLLWIGNYLAAIIPAKDDLFRVTGYLRVLSKESGDANKNKIPLEDMEDDVVELC